jgi:hypothetical protein
MNNHCMVALVHCQFFIFNVNWKSKMANTINLVWVYKNENFIWDHPITIHVNSSLDSIKFAVSDKILFHFSIGSMVKTLYAVVFI